MFQSTEKILAYFEKLMAMDETPATESASSKQTSSSSTCATYSTVGATRPRVVRTKAPPSAARLRLLEVQYRFEMTGTASARPFGDIMNVITSS